MAQISNFKMNSLEIRAASINIMANIHIWGWHRVTSQKMKVFETKRYICKAR